MRPFLVLVSALLLQAEAAAAGTWDPVQASVLATRISASLRTLGDSHQLVIGEGNVLISGNTGTFNSVDSMKSQLERAKMFETVEIVSTNKDKSGKRIRFKLKLQL